jgi:Phosphopantetheine attachment site
MPARLHLQRRNLTYPTFRRAAALVLAASIFARIETTFGVDIPMYSLFDAPTIEQLARQIDCLRQDGD